MFRVMMPLRSASIAAGVAAVLLTMAGPTGAANTQTASTASQAGQPPAGQPSIGQPPISQPHPAAPAMGCVKPGLPLCMDDGTTFVSADKMSSCQFEVKEYVDRTMTYLQCLNDENTATGRDLTRNIERFNCRLSGRNGCGHSQP